MTTDLLLHEVLGTAAIAALTVLVLAAAEVLRRVTPCPPELCRKTAHIGSGISVLLIPLFLDSTWTVLVLVLGFAALLGATHQAGLLQGVHGVDRGVGGVLWYPAMTLTTYVLVFDVLGGSYVDFAIPVLVLALADAAGAVVGQRWGRTHYEVLGHQRTLEGSAAVAGVGFLCVAVPALLWLEVSGLHALAIAAITGLVVATVEAVCIHGVDNLLVPLAALAVVTSTSTMATGQLLVTFMVVAMGAMLLGLLLPETPRTPARAVARD